MLPFAPIRSHSLPFTIRTVRTVCPPFLAVLSALIASHGHPYTELLKEAGYVTKHQRLSEPASAPCFPYHPIVQPPTRHHPHLTTSLTACLKIARPSANSLLEILRGGMNLTTSKTEVESKSRPLSAHNLDTFDATPHGGSFPLDECGLNAGCRPSSHANSMATMRPCPRTSTIQSSGFFCISRRKLSNSTDLAITF